MLSYARAARKRIEKSVEKTLYGFTGQEADLLREQVYNAAYQTEMNNVRRDCAVYRDIQEILIEEGIMPEKASAEKQCFFITVRPAEGALCIASFKQKVFAYLNKKMFIDWALTFEQKDPLGTGTGMHCHIMARVTCRSKGEILRNSIKSFEPHVAANCIDIKPCKTPVETFTRYCIEYVADDGHKELTQEGDRLWRAREALEAVYTKEGGDWASLSSPGGLQENV